MPRPRFDKLEPARRREILDAAEAEFAAHGYADASFNRIIAALQISKGAMYYYFDDKEDLFATVVARVGAELVGVLDVEAPVGTEAEFWTACAAMIERVVAYLRTHPSKGMLARVVAQSMHLEGLRVVMQGWDGHARAFLLRGQAVGAVREDLPLELLARLATAVGQTADVWLAEHIDGMSAEDVERHNTKALGLLRRILEPSSG